LFSGAGTPDVERALAAVRDRLGRDPQKLVADHRAAPDTPQSVLRGRASGTGDIGVSANGKSVELTGPFASGSTFSEN
jgi:hypothetical protein